MTAPARLHQEVERPAHRRAGGRARRRLGWLDPVLSPMLASRTLAVWLCLGGVGQLVLTRLGITVLPCPLLHSVGVPCPGCGGTRACEALLHGDWASWLRLHVFAPFFLLAIVLFLGAAFLPRRLRHTLVRVTDRLERRFAIVHLLLGLLLVYWAARLVYDPAAFARLMKPL